MTAASLIVRTNIDRKLGIVELTLLPVFNKSIKSLVAPRLARHYCHLGLTRLGCQLFINLDPGVEEEEEEGAPTPGYPAAGPRLIGLGNNNTHYNHGPLFSRHHESLPSLSPATRHGAERNIATSLNIITSIETMRILRHLRSEEPGSEFVYQPWVVPAL